MDSEANDDLLGESERDNFEEPGAKDDLLGESERADWEELGAKDNLLGEDERDVIGANEDLLGELEQEDRLETDCFAGPVPDRAVNITFLF